MFLDQRVCMPNIKSAKKRVLQTEKKHALNVARKSAIKTAVRKVLVALENNDVESAKELLRQAESQLARAQSKRVVHKKTAQRKISRLAKRVVAAQK
jgi:small subunit ribosomal protein S20